MFASVPRWGKVTGFPSEVGVYGRSFCRQNYTLRFILYTRDINTEVGEERWRTENVRCGEKSTKTVYERYAATVFSCLT